MAKPRQPSPGVAAASQAAVPLRGEGHFMGFDHWREILEQLVS